MIVKLLSFFFLNDEKNIEHININKRGWKIHKHLTRKQITEYGFPNHKIAITSTHAKNYKNKIQWKQKVEAPLNTYTLY